MALRDDVVTWAHQPDIGIAFAAHVSGLLFGIATIISLAPAAATLMRLILGKGS
jgi:membrane associated rhomboid family serine protease